MAEYFTKNKGQTFFYNYVIISPCIFIKSYILCRIFIQFTNDFELNAWTY